MFYYQDNKFGNLTVPDHNRGGFRVMEQTNNRLSCLGFGFLAAIIISSTNRYCVYEDGVALTFSGVINIPIDISAHAR